MVGAFRELRPEETASCDRIRRRLRPGCGRRNGIGGSGMPIQVPLSCSPYSAMAYEAFHP